jgi:predicted nucleic acid-binding Zn ribbon protein
MTKHIPKEELIDLYINQGMSINAISKKYNCDFRTVKKRLEEYNIPTRSRKEQREKEVEIKLGFPLTSEMIMEKINEGLLITQAADFFNVNHKTVRKRLKEDGIDLTKLESYQKRIEEYNRQTSLGMWANDPNRKKEHYEKLKRINEKRSEKADVRYEMAHLKSPEEYKKACARIADRYYGTKRPEGMQIDHKYSVHDGYMNGVPAPVLSHPFNLRLITAEENLLKGHDSIITLEELYKGTGQKWDGSKKEIKSLKRHCLYCGDEFPYDNKVKYKRFCDKDCRSKYKYKEEVANSKTVNRNCVICGKPFPIKEIFTTVTCGRECAAKHNHLRRKQNKRMNPLA